MHFWAFKRCAQLLYLSLCHKQTILSQLIVLGSIEKGFDHLDRDLLDVLRRSHVANWDVSASPCCVSGTGSCSRDELVGDLEVVVPGIAFQHRVPQCLVCVVYAIQPLPHFVEMRKHCTSSTTQIHQTTRSRAAGINFCSLKCWSQEVYVATLLDDN